MKKFIYSFVFTLCAVSLFAQAGILDNTFGTKGVKTLQGEGVGLLVDLTMDAGKDGKVIFLQNANQSFDTPAYFIKRLLPNGNPDATFGKNGVVRLDYSFLNAYGFINSAKIASDGKILLTGFGVKNLTDTSSKIMTLRLNTNGTLDNTFGTKGVALLSTSTAVIIGFTSLLLNDGKLLIGGSQANAGKFESVLTRLNTNGTIDNTFGKNGFFTLKLKNANNSSIVDLLLDKQNNIYALCGYSNTPDDNSTALIKLNAVGTQITTGFGTAGVIVLTTNIDKVKVTGAALQSNGKIVVGIKEVLDKEVKKNTLVRHNIDGTVDKTFGTAGIILVSENSTATKFDDMYSVKTMGGNDKILVNIVGYDEVIAKLYNKVIRYSVNGAIDNTFGKKGEVLVESDTLLSTLSTMVIQENTNTIFLMAQAENEDEDQYNVFAKILNPFGVATKENIEVRNFSVYPTLVETDATLTYDLDETETVTIQLIDMQGRVVENYLSNELQNAGKYQQTITMPNTMPKGAYFITLTNSKGSTSTKIIK
jgi:uncharacterized delta-60 repeat protein